MPCLCHRMKRETTASVFLSHILSTFTNVSVVWESLRWTLCLSDREGGSPGRREERRVVRVTDRQASEMSFSIDYLYPSHAQENSVWCLPWLGSSTAAVAPSDRSPVKSSKQNMLKEMKSSSLTATAKLITLRLKVEKHEEDLDLPELRWWEKNGWLFWNAETNSRSQRSIWWTAKKTEQRIWL